MGDEFPWFYNKNVVHSNAFCDELDHYQMTHRFYLDNVPSSGYWNIIQPLINKINPKSLIRAKANLIPRNQKIIRHGFHVDYEFECTTAIYYVNTNDGYTEFQDGTKVESVANRLVTFDSRIEHTGSTCTDSHIRVNINFNYF